jgi:hypothetical protein
MSHFLGEYDRPERPVAVDLGGATVPQSVRRTDDDPEDPTRIDRARCTREDVERVFAVQPTSSEALPDPGPIARDLALCVAEIMSGARELETIARWVTDDVHRHLHIRASMAARARSATGRAVRRPILRAGSVIVSEPADGVAEVTVVVHTRTRTRAVAIRLEGLDGRWRATSIGVL